MSENAAFATAVRNAGIRFIGPSAAAMATLGDKREAKDYLRKHDPRVPLIPSFTGNDSDVVVLEQAASQIGYPVMLKASAGGGGRGMRIVREASKLRAELASAQSEAARSFGSSDCILEKYIEAGKHIEFQIIGDSHGNVLSLWDRECSVQRRHQKVIEESPSPYLTAEKRQQMSEAAVRVGKLIGYENAGTVEFIFDTSDGSFYFLEMNTRLQVEHPITEEVTGIDIVSLQMYVAAGGDLISLPRLQNISQNGHAIECRLCAEDPQNNFFPEHGTVKLWKPAALAITKENESRNVRFETGVETGSQISIHFDSMIAKIVVWAPTRTIAIQKAASVLSQTVCLGVKTNQQFLQNCLLHPRFQDPAYTTAFIPQNLGQLLADSNFDVPPAQRRTLALIPSIFLRTAAEYIPSLQSKHGPFSQVRPGFRNQRFDPVNKQLAVISTSHETLLCQWVVNNSSSARLAVNLQLLPDSPQLEETTSAASQVTAQYNAISNALRENDSSSLSKERPFVTDHEIEILTCKVTMSQSKASSSAWSNAYMTVLVDGTVYHCCLSTEDMQLDSYSSTAHPKKAFCHVLGNYSSWFSCKYYDLLSYCESTRQAVVAHNKDSQRNIVTAPMPCKVLNVLRKNGEEVKEGETVVVVESMKMEMNIAAPQSGIFNTGVKLNDTVHEGSVLCQIL